MPIPNVFHGHQDALMLRVSSMLRTARFRALGVAQVRALACRASRSFAPLLSKEMGEDARGVGGGHFDASRSIAHSSSHGILVIGLGILRKIPKTATSQHTVTFARRLG